MKAITFHTVLPFACALIPVKLKFAKIQTADTPPCVPTDVEDGISWPTASMADAKKIVISRQKLLVKFLDEAC